MSYLYNITTVNIVNKKAPLYEALLINLAKKIANYRLLKQEWIDI